MGLVLDFITGKSGDTMPRAGDGYFTGELVKDVLDDAGRSMEELPDYVDDVRTLDKTPHKIWQNSKADTFRKNGKINFLHLDDTGLFTLTIIKPGSKNILDAHIPAEMVEKVRTTLQDMTDWDKSSSPETWDKADGDSDGNTYMFNRSLTLLEDLDFVWKLQWEGRHKNRGNIVEVRDVLRFVKVPPIILGKK